MFLSKKDTVGTEQAAPAAKPAQGSVWGNVFGVNTKDKPQDEPALG
jgi:hypothetical protein